MENRSELSKEQLDVLQEVGNIGIGNAASALADLLKTKINIAIPRLGVVPFHEAFKLIGGMEDSVIGVQLRLTGDASGIVLFLFTEEGALTLTNKLISQTMGVECKNTQFDEMSQSAIQEISNILTGTFINALAQMTQLVIYTSPPAFAHDMLGAIISTSLAGSQQGEDEVFILETQFFEKQDAIKGHFLLLPNPGTLKKILNGLEY